MEKQAGNIQELIEQLKDKKVLLRQRIRPVKPFIKRRKAAAKRKAGASKAEKAAKHRAQQKRIQDTISGSWYMLQRAYRARAKRRAGRGTKPVSFELSLEDWKKLWEAAGMVWHNGVYKAAFYGRGRMPSDVKLWRIDEDKPWTLDNCVVMFNGAVIANGRKI